MPNPKKNLSSASAQNHKTIKPPKNLWEMLQEEFDKKQPPKDPFVFTRKRYAKELGVSRNVALRLIEELIIDGKAEAIGQFGRNGEWYYRLK